ncbi:MAG: DUF1150 family protein [Alphaproteobacteria bacterium]
MDQPQDFPRAIMTDEALAALGKPHTVYVRAIPAHELRDEVAGLDAVPGDMVLYSVHAADGTRMAVMDKIETAFSVARDHEMQPVNVN